MLVFLGGVDLWRPFGAGTLKHKVWISPKDISSGMQHQMDLMENTFLLFRVFAVSFSILQHRALVHAFDPVPSISPALAITLPYAHTPPNFPFVCFCGMFAFLSSLS